VKYKSIAFTLFSRWKINIQGGTAQQEDLMMKDPLLSIKLFSLVKVPLENRYFDG
jgi:hypothetical protein